MIRRLRPLTAEAAIVLALAAFSAVQFFEWVMVRYAHLVPATTATTVAETSLLFAALVHEHTRGRVP